MKQRIVFGHQYAGQKIENLVSVQLEVTPRDEAIEMISDLVNSIYDLYEYESDEQED